MLTGIIGPFEDQFGRSRLLTVRNADQPEAVVYRTDRVRINRKFTILEYQPHRSDRCTEFAGIDLHQ